MLGTIRAILADPAYLPADRARDQITAERVEELESSLRAVAETKMREAAYLDSLPIATAKANARVREAPTRQGRVIAALDELATVAIVEKQGRWARIVYADPLTSEPREGWVWRGSIIPLNTEEEQ